MHREKALRFLLLRHLWLRRHEAGPARQRAVARSLTVTRAGDGFVAQWRDGAQQRRLEIAASEVALYRRGDEYGAGGAAGGDRINAALGARFAALALGLPEQSAPPAARAGARWAAADLAAALPCLGVALWLLVTAAAVFWPLAAMLALWAAAGVWRPWGGLAAAGATLLVPLLAVMPFTGLLGGLGLAAATVLDPDPRLRPARVVLALAAAAWSASQIRGVPGDGIVAVAALAGGAALVAIGSLFGSALGPVLVALPAVAAGLVLDGAGILAWLAPLAATGLGAALCALAPRLWPAQGRVSASAGSRRNSAASSDS
ncbi:MAG: hypothetical protein R3F55_00410 [Alphaproteobacteria bacterium]